MTHEYARASFNLHCSSCSSSSYCSSGSLVGEAEAGALGSTGFSPSALNKQVILTLSKRLQLGNFQLQTWALNEAQFDKDIIFLAGQVSSIPLFVFESDSHFTNCIESPNFFLTTPNSYWHPRPRFLSSTKFLIDKHTHLLANPNINWLPKAFIGYTN